MTDWWCQNVDHNQTKTLKTSCHVKFDILLSVSTNSKDVKSNGVKKCSQQKYKKITGVKVSLMSNKHSK